MSRWATILMAGTSAGASAALASLERGHHLPGADLGGPHLLSDWQEPAGIQLGGDPGQAELFLQLSQPVDQAPSGAEGDLGGQDLLVRQTGELLRLGLSPFRRDPGAADRRPRQIGLPAEV